MPFMRPTNKKRRTMKKLIVTTVLFLLILSVTEVSGQVSFGVKGSFDMFNMTVKDSDGDKSETGLVPRFDAGVFAEYTLADEFFIRPELLFATKGMKLKESSHEPVFNVSYLQLPVLFLYKGTLSTGKVLLGFGPYLAMGIGGKYRYDDSEVDVKFKNNVTGSTVSVLYFKPFDFGAQLMAGYELAGGLSIALNTSMGLTNITPKYNGEKPESSIANVGFGLTLGYLFGKN
jgi:hypothetical protein